jgi:tripeptide aminopeptidase
MTKKLEDYPSLVDRFLKYVKIHTTADEKSDTRPSTMIQHDMLDELMKELEELGLEDIEKTDYADVFATLPANLPADHPAPEKVPTIGFIAHVDTYPATPGENVKPQLVKNYDGGKIKLNDEVELDPAVDEGLKDLVGHDIIHTDGTTLLGADDKSGVAEIMHALTILTTDKSIHHGTIKVGFTVDEEIGKGADDFDIEHFGADFAYTMDGSRLGEVEDETFCADSAIITIEGYDVHPGYGKDKLINALRVASHIIGNYPKDKLPETTEKKQPYLHPIELSGNVSKATLTSLVRAFTVEELKELEDHLQELCDDAEKAFPGSKCSIEIVEYYRNMKMELDKYPHVMDLAREAMRNADIEPITKPIRGGTDGSRLTLMGLPTPNIFAGGENFHSVKEYVSIQVMAKAVKVILGIANLAQEKAAKGEI